MNVIVTDTGFAEDDWPGDICDLPCDSDPASLETVLNEALVRITFPSSSDGRGFTLARLLRLRGFRGRLRAAGHVIADQYAMVRRAGFDEVEIDDALAKRQPEDQWLFRADWRAHDYQARLGGLRMRRDA
jgi:uncharacterized protein (DUF934 family)